MDGFNIFLKTVNVHKKESKMSLSYSRKALKNLSTPKRTVFKMRERSYDS